MIWRQLPEPAGLASVIAPRSTARPLVVATDEELLDSCVRLVAAAGAEAEVSTGGPALRRAHGEAPLVLLGADVLSAPPVRALPRRPGVVVVASAPLPADDWAAAVEVGAERVVLLPDEEPWLLSRVAAAVRNPVERGAVLAVSGSCGGAGASTVSAALALAAAPGAVLVDGDPWGGGLDLVLGAERTDGLRWPDLTGLRGRVAGDALLAALPEVSGVHVLAAARSAPSQIPVAALTAVTEAAAAVGCTVVLDLPRGEPLSSSAAASADLALLVVPARLRAAGAARLLVDTEGSPWSRAGLVVRTVPGGLASAEVEEVVGRPVLATLPHDRSAVPRAERGELPSVVPRSPLGTVARRVLSVLHQQRRAA
jgi:secretion/DNA translocation related CpaE-like protein